MSNEDLDKIDARYQGAYLEAADLMGREFYSLTIKSIAKPDTEKDSGGKKIDKYIITFEGAKKRLIVNVTNFRIITAELGDKLTGWIGKKIDLEARVLKEAFGEKNVPVVRVRPGPDTLLKSGAKRNRGRALTDDEREKFRAKAQKPAPPPAPLLDDRKPAPVAVKPVETGNKPDADMVEDLKQRIAQVALENGDSEREVAERLLVYTKNSKPVTAPSPEWFLAGETEDERINRHVWLIEVYTAAFQ